jgi:dihydropteroate synthase
MRVLEVSNQKDLKSIMQDIKVDPYGIKIMVPKAITHLVRINSVSNIAANILKQEMLSLGGDVAIARHALTGKSKKTDCLVMGNLTQLIRLNDKLNRQPFGLSNLAKDLSQTLTNYQKNNFILNLGKYKLNLNLRTFIVGIVNLTPDSFSGDGLYRVSGIALPAACLPDRQGRQGYRVSDVVDFVEKMVDDGADIVDIGGESSRPGAKAVSVKEEIKRVIPVIKALAKKIKVPISIDTYKPQVARQALDNGAAIVNDITGLRNLKMAKLVARYNAGVVIMHMKGNPRTMQINPEYESLIDEIIEFLDKAIKRAQEIDVDKEKIIVDPGIGFGKTLEHNLEILKRLRELKVLGRPILVGPSRKSFIGKILNVQAQERLSGTLSACVLAVKNGANLVRVHDVKEVKQALKVLDKIERV